MIDEASIFGFLVTVLMGLFTIVFSMVWYMLKELREDVKQLSGAVAGVRICFAKFEAKQNGSSSVAE